MRRSFAAGVRRPKAWFLAAALAVGGWGAILPGAAWGDDPPATAPAPKNVFQNFTGAVIERGLMHPIIQLFRDRRYADAEKVLRRLVEKFPDSPLYHYNLAAALARQGRTDEALVSLSNAVRRGFSNRAIAERDADLEPLRGHAQFPKLMARMDALAAEAAKHAPAARVGPAKIEQGRAVVDEANTRWDARNNILIAQFAFEPKARGAIVHGGKEPVAQLLNGWYAKGEAAGNHGDLYDNRDRGHSRFSGGLLPQVSHIEYGAAAREVSIDYGVNSGILFNAITFGNSSTALNHAYAWRSQARLILTNTDLVAHAFLQYAANHLYVYPEHLDHDTDHGDLMPANTPYMLISQGSSGSDQPLLHAVGAILASFRPEVKQLLRSRKLVMPTVQMVLRRGQKQVRGTADYLSAKAHPTVFPAAEIDLVRLAELAHGLRADAIPPMVQLAVTEEDKTIAGLDYFAPPTIGERLFDTPSAIARLVRATRYRRHLVVDASATKDPNGRPLVFRWVVLRGDAERIKITPLDKTGAKAAIEVPWHERRPVPTSPELMTDRVDIGVFADNGAGLSAPAFVTFFYPGNQKRSYDKDGHIRCIDYDSAELRKRYVDPALFPVQEWRDCYEYDTAMRLTGWNRVKKGSVQRFTRNGEKVVEEDRQGRPVLAERVRYELEVLKSGRPRVVQVPAGAMVRYVYRGPEDRIGTASVEK